MELAKKFKCPCCGSREILNLDSDQICLDCGWNNAIDLVVSGQFDQELAEFELDLAIQKKEARAPLTPTRSQPKIKTA